MKKISPILHARIKTETARRTNKQGYGSKQKQHQVRPISLPKIPKRED